MCTLWAQAGRTRRLEPNAYCRNDGTRTYFFSHVRSLTQSALLSPEKRCRLFDDVAMAPGSQVDAAKLVQAWSTVHVLRMCTA